MTPGTANGITFIVKTKIGKNLGQKSNKDGEILIIPYQFSPWGWKTDLPPVMRTVDPRVENRYPVARTATPASRTDAYI